MKSILTTFLVLLVVHVFCSTATAQTSAELPSPYEFKLIDSADLSKDELFTRARAWVAYICTNANNAIKMDDRGAGKIIFKGAHGAAGYKAGNISFTCTIDVKEHKYRITLTEFSHVGKWNGSNFIDGGPLDSDVPNHKGILGITMGDWKTMRRGEANQANLMMTSFNEAVKNNTQVKAKNSNDGF